MSKKMKIFIVLIVVAALGVTVFFVGRRLAVDFVFDKVYNEVINEMREDEKNEKTQSTVTTVNGEENVSANETENGYSAENEKQERTSPENKTSQNAVQSTTDVAIKKLSELTNQELQEIQALVTSADKAAAISIVKSALTADDKREIKAMLESGKIDYARCKQIASARLSVAQKKQIYAYYEKYARIYFADK